jgi:hypothetical protein
LAICSIGMSRSLLPNKWVCFGTFELVEFVVCVCDNDAAEELLVIEVQFSIGAVDFRNYSIPWLVMAMVRSLMVSMSSPSS